MAIPGGCGWATVETLALCWALIATLAAPAAGGVSTVSVFSPANGRNLSFQVYTPPGYVAGDAQRYPTVVSLHGIHGTSLQRAGVYGPVLDARINAGELVPTIWVFPDGQTNSFWGDAFDGHKQVAAHVLDDVLPYVDANYQTRAHRNYRAMEGFSMGGFGAALYTAKHPELFSAVVEYGGALSTWASLTAFNSAVAEEMYDTVEANWLPYSLWDVTAANAAALRDTVNYKMIVGDVDPQLTSNTRFRDFVVGLGIDPQFQIVPGVEHVGGSYLNEGSGLRFLSEHFAAAPAPSGDFDRDGDVDGADFVLWQRELGLGGGPAADGNYDGVVDDADLAVWRSTFGGAGVAAAVGAAPEPGSAVLLGLACALRLRRRRSG